jgi:hypothetical protein
VFRITAALTGILKRASLSGIDVLTGNFFQTSGIKTWIVFRMNA